LGSTTNSRSNRREAANTTTPLNPMTSRSAEPNPRPYDADMQQNQSVLVTTTEKPAGYDVKQSLGQVFGVVVRSRGLGGNIMAGLRALGGGEITEFTRLVEDTRRHAIDRMVENARAMGANAVVMMRFDSSEIGQTMAEVVAYGTAAIVEQSTGA
jgi:uncharacterized protein YbjQ (UPF0145 family)